MTNKQIIIDGIDVSDLCLDKIACMDRYEIVKLFTKLVEVLSKTEDDYNKAQENRVEMWTDNTYLTERLKLKEQECNKLKEENFIFESLIKEYEKYGAIEDILQQLNQLKTENAKYKQILAEIKEIAENAYCLTNGTNKDMANFAKQILQIIGNVYENPELLEVEND